MKVTVFVNKNDLTQVTLLVGDRVLVDPWLDIITEAASKKTFDVSLVEAVLMTNTMHSALMGVRAFLYARHLVNSHAPEINLYADEDFPDKYMSLSMTSMIPDSEHNYDYHSIAGRISLLSATKLAAVSSKSSLDHATTYTLLLQDPANRLNILFANNRSDVVDLSRISQSFVKSALIIHDAAGGNHCSLEQAESVPNAYFTGGNQIQDPRFLPAGITIFKGRDGQWTRDR